MLGNPQSIYNIHKLYSDLEQKIKNPALTNQQKLIECDNFIRSQQEITLSNAEHISNAYKLSGDLFYKNKEYEKALENYTHQKNLLNMIKESKKSLVTSRVSLVDTYFNIANTKLMLNDLDGAKESFVKAWNMNDEVVSARVDKNETTPNYSSRSAIFSCLESIAEKQNDTSTLLDLCTSYAKKLKVPGVCLPIRDVSGISIRPFKSSSLASIEFKCLLAIQLFNFLSNSQLKERKNDKALTHLNFALEKINEFELFNRRFKDEKVKREAPAFKLDPEIFVGICLQGSKLCLEKNDNVKFKEYILKGLEYCEKLTDQQLKKDYHNFLFENIDKINSISPTNSAQDLEITSKIHDHICNSFTRGSDFDKTMQLYTSFIPPDPLISNPKLFKIFVDKHHHISQIHKKNFGDDARYKELIREEYKYLLQLGNLISSESFKDNKDLSNKDKLEIFDRIVENPNILGLKKDKFEQLSIEINQVVIQEQALISSQNIYENNYKISGSSYIFAPNHNHESSTRLVQVQRSSPMATVPAISAQGRSRSIVTLPAIATFQDQRSRPMVTLPAITTFQDQRSRPLVTLPAIATFQDQRSRPMVTLPAIATLQDQRSRPIVMVPAAISARDQISAPMAILPAIVLGANHAEEGRTYKKPKNQDYQVARQHSQPSDLSNLNILAEIALSGLWDNSSSPSMQPSGGTSAEAVSRSGTKRSGN